KIELRPSTSLSGRSRYAPVVWPRPLSIRRRERLATPTRSQQANLRSVTIGGSGTDLAHSLSCHSFDGLRQRNLRGPHRGAVRAMAAIGTEYPPTNGVRSGT